MRVGNKPRAQEASGTSVANGNTQWTREWVIDATGKANVAGPGINIAQRVMDCGDAGHILLSKHVAEDLEEYPHWQPHLHELGECEVKHGVRLSLVNLYTEELGNPAVPEKLEAARVAVTARRKRATFRWLSLGM